MGQKSENQCYNSPCTTMMPAGTDVCVGHNDCKIQADITVERVRNVIIWGNVTDCMGTPVPDALVKLMKYTGECGSELKEICRTHTDCNGYYQFDLEYGCEGRYRVLVNACTSCEKECKSRVQRNDEPCTAHDICYDKQYNNKSCSCRSTTRNNIQYY